MPGSRNGGLKAKAKNIANDPDFYKKIGKLGGSKSRTGGFASDKIGPDGLTGAQRASRVGRIGGLKSRRYSSLYYEGTRDHLDQSDRRS